MNRKLVLGGLAGIAAVALTVGGTTYSAWSDFRQINGNETDAGHLVLNLNGSGTISNVGGNAIAPGQSRTIDQYLTSANLDGVPSAALSVTFKNLANYEHGCSSNSELAEDPTCGTAGDQGEFAQESYVRVRYSDPQTGLSLAPNGDCKPVGGYTHAIDNADVSDNNTADYPSLATFTSEGAHELGDLTAGQGVCVRFDIGLPSAADNKSQGDTSVWDMQYDLVQNP